MTTVVTPENAEPRVAHVTQGGGSVYGPVFEIAVTGGNEHSRKELIFRAASAQARLRNWRGIVALHRGKDDGQTLTATYRECPKSESMVALYTDKQHPLEAAKAAEGHVLTARLEITVVLRNGRWELDDVNHPGDDGKPMIHRINCTCSNQKACEKARRAAEHIPLPEHVSNLADLLNRKKNALARQARETRKRWVDEYRAAAAAHRKLQQDNDGDLTAELIDQLRQHEQTLARLARNMWPLLATVLGEESRLEMLLWRHQEEGVQAKRLRRELKAAGECIASAVKRGPEGESLPDTVVTVPYTPTLDEQRELKQSNRRFLGEAPVPQDEGRDYDVCSWCDQEAATHERNSDRQLVRDWHRIEVNDAEPGFYADEINQCVRTGMLVEYRHNWKYT
jgi:hypothetical protein